MIRRRRFLLVLGVVVVGVLALEHTHGRVPRVLEHSAAIRFAAEDAGLDPALIAALIHVESGGDPSAGMDGAGLGLMQLTLTTARYVAKKPDLSRDDLMDPSVNIMLGSKYLEGLLGRFKDERIALAAYRLGPSRIADEIEKAGSREKFLSGFRDHRAWLYVAKVRDVKKVYKRFL